MCYTMPILNLSLLGEPSLEPPCNAPVYCPCCDKESQKLDKFQIECYNCDKIYEIVVAEPDYDYFDEERYA